MPARKEGHVTELETYYWVSSDVSEFLKKYKDIQYDVTRKFKKISSQFDGLQKFYKRNDKDIAKKGKKKETGGRYIFQKTLECYIIRKLNLSDKGTIERLRNILGSVYNDKENQHVDAEMKKAREELEKIVTEKDAYFNEELTKDISYGSWVELLNTRCNFICGESGNCTGRCTPRILLELFEIVKPCKVRNEKVIVYSLVELEGICICLIQLLPLGWCEADYIKIWNNLEYKVLPIEQDTPKDAEENKPDHVPTIFSSTKRLQYGKSDDIEGEWLIYFKHYYVKQCENTELIEKLFKRLTKSFKGKENELYKQVNRWYVLWEYIINRYVELREIESKMRKSKLRFDMLINLLKWEFIHKDFEINTDKEWKEVNRAKEKYVDEKLDEQEMQEKSDMRNTSELLSIADPQKYELEFMQEKCCEKIKKLITKSLFPAKKKLLEIGIKDTTELSFIVFEDLERIIEFMDIGWMRGKSAKRYSQKIIGILQDERVSMVSIVGENAVQEERPI